MYDINQVRADFPILSRTVYDKPLVYLDNAATTQKPLCVLDAMRDEYLNVNANVHRGVHYLSQLAKENLDLARTRLINIMCNYQGFRRCNLILVFDAYRVKGNHREIETEMGITVVYTKEAETADMYIEKTAHELGRNHRVRVATSDNVEQIIILGNGAIRVSATEFLAEVTEVENTIRKIIEEKYN